ncbi:alanine racemase [Shewanella algae]|uniref:alanine racemase n=1 Tax=Shewanella algae TaxID=38313 RepID=UPI00313CEB9B
MITAEVVINLKAFKDNLSLLRASSNGSTLVLILKANAYGHGAVELASVLDSEYIVSVARIGEAIDLRNNGIVNPILLLEGCFDDSELYIASRNDFIVTIHDIVQLESFLRAELPKPVGVWLKLNTGMNRLGIESEQVGLFIDSIKASTNLSGEIVLFSHFANSDNSEDSFSFKQLNLFNIVREKCGLRSSIANSAAFVKGLNCNFDYIRLGISLYGIVPSVDINCFVEGLKPVMTFKSRIISIRQIGKDQIVSYGCKWTSSRATKIAVVAMGYADGYPRNIPENTALLIKSFA